MALTPWQKRLLAPYNRFVETFVPDNLPQTTWPELKQVEEKARVRTDIASHLRNMFLYTVSSQPDLIVELGTKKGFSAYALSRAAIVTGATFVSVDNRDFSKALSWDQWIFVQMDDIEFARQFPTWCSERQLESTIDVLFIDTSHTYEHTKAEIAAYFPLLSSRGRVMFHDTNCSDWYLRRNLTIDRSYDSKRGVIRAIEDYFGRSFDEKNRFNQFIDGWWIHHDPICNGLMTLTKIA